MDEKNIEKVINFIEFELLCNYFIDHINRIKYKNYKM